MSKLTLLRTHQGSPEIQQSRLMRGWMDDTYNKHAYRCLPLSMANVNGWEILLPCDVVVKWDGGDTVPTLVSGGEYNNRMVADCNKIGMVDFPLEPYIKLGFHRFKLLRARPGSVTGF